MNFKKSGLLSKIKEMKNKFSSNKQKPPKIKKFNFDKFKNKFSSNKQKPSKIKKFNFDKFKNKFRLKGINWLKRKKQLRLYLNKAGFDIRSDELIKKIFNIGIFINLGLSAVLLYIFAKNVVPWATVAITIFFLWVLIFIAIIISEWIIFYTLIDLKIYQRKLEIEEVLPDFLQLTSSNIKAGMPIDKALWYAVRPRFGVLAKEIEFVAKETMGGENFQDALRNFGQKYDSIILRRSINMLIEGIEAGGEIGDLLTKIADNIQEHQIMLKEISASVTTYSIFITFSAIVAAPFLFALSGALIGVVHDLSTTFSLVSGAAAGSIPLSFGEIGITIGDFKIFAVLSLLITSLFSAIVVATIKKGNIRSGIKYLPVFSVIALTIYFLSLRAVNIMLSSVF